MVRAPQLKRLRDARALTQEELAARSGVSRNTIMRAEHGANIRQGNLRALARVLGVSPATLQRPDEN